MENVFRNASPNVLNFIDFNNLNYGEVLSFLTPETRKKMLGICMILSVGSEDIIQIGYV